MPLSKQFLALAVFGFISITRALAFPVEVAVAPRNDLTLTTKALETAKKDLYINIYEMKSQVIGDAIVKQIQAGVHVEILQEGQPVGGVSKDETAIQKKIVSAMEEEGNDHYYVMTSKAETTKAKKRRYRYDHAKYVIVDGKSLLIGSENFSENSHPPASKPGNRGWETLVQDAGLAKQFRSTFEGDADVSQGDVEDLVDNSRHVSLPVLPLSNGLRLAVPAKSGESALPDNQSFDADTITPILSPDSLSGLQSLLKSAKKSLKLEMMTFSPKWGRTGEDSPLLAAVEAAARRGVNVQVLLNDETVFSHGKAETSTNNNANTVKILNKLADDENLALEARTANIKKMKVSYIHNKGVLVDGKRVLISSINWNQNSVENNREAGVILDSSDVYDFYQPVFDSDWKVSE